MSLPFKPSTPIAERALEILEELAAMRGDSELDEIFLGRRKPIGSPIGVALTAALKAHAILALDQLRGVPLAEIQDAKDRRSALSRPAPATEAKCGTVTTYPHDPDPRLAEVMTKVNMPPVTFHATPRAGASEGEVIERCAKVAEDCACPHARDDKSSRYGFCGHARCGHFHEAADAIRALRPTPPPAEGVGWRTLFHRAWTADVGTPGYDKRAWANVEAKILAAERAERGGKGE